MTLQLTDFSFAVYPRNFDDSFDPFILDVPSDDQDAAARRAYFTAMAHMASRGFDVEDFCVCVFQDNKPGPLVGSGGIEKGLGR